MPRLDPVEVVLRRPVKNERMPWGLKLGTATMTLLRATALSVAARSAAARGCVGMQLVMVNDVPVSHPADVTKCSELFPVMSLRFVPKGDAAESQRRKSTLRHLATPLDCLSQSQRRSLAILRAAIGVPRLISGHFGFPQL